jgi:putative oxidoreductase
MKDALMSSVLSTNPLNLIGRLALAAVFLPAGWSKLTDFGGTVGYIESVGLPLATLAALIAIVVEIAGGIALIIGFFTRGAAFALALFTLVASVLFHPYWAMAADQAFVQQLMFFKNIGIFGGLLVLAAQGPGQLSLDAKRAGTSS